MNKFTLIAGAMIAASLAAGSATAQSRGGTGTDARGIAVVSAPATAPTGANQALTIPPGATVTVNPNQSSVFTSTAAVGDMPPCTKAVTDHCTQTYEGHGAKMMAHHKGHRAMHKRMHKQK